MRGLVDGAVWDGSHIYILTGALDMVDRIYHKIIVV